jgi:hypothetical protein
MNDVVAIQRTVRRCTAILVVLVCIIPFSGAGRIPSPFSAILFVSFLGSVLYLFVSVLESVGEPTRPRGTGEDD